MEVLLIAAAGDDVGGGVDLANREGGEHGGVVAVGSDDDGLRLPDPGLIEHGAVRGVAPDGDEALVRSVGNGTGVDVDSDDPVWFHPAADEVGGGGCPGRTKTENDVVISHAAPPASDEKKLPGPIREHLDGGANHEDQEHDPGRGDEGDRGQTGPVRHGGDVAVAGCRDGHRRVVERVEEPDLVARVVDVAVSAEQHDERNENDERYGEADPAADFAQR